MNTTKTACKNMFLSEDGFCSQCGENHWKSEPKTRKPVTRSDEQLKCQTRADLISLGIENDPVYKTARDTAELLMSVFGVSCPVIFRNRQDSCYKAIMTAGKLSNEQMIFGYQCLKDFAESGYQEYVSLSHFVKGNPRGAEAAKWIAAHEFAHLLTTHRYGRVAPHGYEFQKTYREVISVLF